MTTIRASESAARIGGDEFAIISHVLTTRAAIDGLVKRVKATVAAPITLADGTIVSVTASGGLAVLQETHDRLDGHPRALERLPARVHSALPHDPLAGIHRPGEAPSGVGSYLSEVEHLSRNRLIRPHLAMPRTVVVLHEHLAALGHP